MDALSEQLAKYLQKQDFDAAAAEFRKYDSLNLSGLLALAPN